MKRKLLKGEGHKSNVECRPVSGRIEGPVDTVSVQENQRFKIVVERLPIAGEPEDVVISQEEVRLPTGSKDGVLRRRADCQVTYH